MSASSTHGQSSYPASLSNHVKLRPSASAQPRARPHQDLLRSLSCEADAMGEVENKESIRFCFRLSWFRFRSVQTKKGNEGRKGTVSLSSVDSIVSFPPSVLARSSPSSLPLRCISLAPNTASIWPEVPAAPRSRRRTRARKEGRGRTMKRSRS